MYKRASRQTGGTTLSGWSTRKGTAPADHRQRPNPQVRPKATKKTASPIKVITRFISADKAEERRILRQIEANEAVPGSTAAVPGLDRLALKLAKKIREEISVIRASKLPDALKRAALEKLEGKLKTFEKKRP